MSNAPYSYTTRSNVICPCFPGAYLIDSYGSAGTEYGGAIPIFASMSSFITNYSFSFSRLLILPGYYCKIVTSSTDATVLFEYDNSSGNDIATYETTNKIINSSIVTTLKFKGNEVKIVTNYGYAGSTNNPLGWFNNMWVAGVWFIVYAGAMYPLHYSSTSFYFANRTANTNFNQHGFFLLPGFSVTITKSDNTTQTIGSKTSTNFALGNYFTDTNQDIKSYRIYYNDVEITAPA